MDETVKLTKLGNCVGFYELPHYFLSDTWTFIPIMRREGNDEMAQDLEKALDLIEKGKRDEDLEQFFEGTVIPHFHAIANVETNPFEDRKRAEAIAQLFEEAVYWIQKQEMCLTIKTMRLHR